MLLIAPALTQAGSWRAVWWFGAGCGVGATVLYLAFVKPAPQPMLGKRPGRAAPAAVQTVVTAGSVLRNRNIWLLSAAFGCFSLAVGAFGTFFPTFLSTVRGLPLGRAALLASISTLITIFSCPAGGLVSDRIGSRRWPFVVGLAVSGVLLPLTGSLAIAPLIVLLAVIGLVMGLIPTNIFSAAVEAAGDERQSGLAMAIMMIGQNGGMLLGAARSLGVDLASVCGGAGTCGRCKVQLIAGSLTDVTAGERHSLSERELSQGYRLALSLIHI